MPSKFLESEFHRAEQLPYGNGKAIIDFISSHTYKKKSIGEKRKLKIMQSLRCFSSILNAPLTRFGGDEIIKIMDTLAARQTKRGKDYSLHTWKGYRKDAILWAKQVSPAEVWFRELNRHDVKKALEIANPYSDKDYNKKLKRSLFFNEEILKLLSHGDCMEKAIVVTLNFTGIRPCELLSLKPSSIRFLEDGSCIVSLETSKTYVRDIKLRSDLAHYLADWVNQNGNSEYLFHNNDGLPLDNAKLRHILQNLSVRTGLGKWITSGTGNQRRYHYEGKAITAYSFRRNHARWCVRNMRPESASKRMWGNVNSGMVRVYLGMDDTDANNDYDLASGGIEQKPEQAFLDGNFCGKCRKFYPATVKLCPEHGMPISAEEMEKAIVKPQVDYNEIFSRMDSVMDLKMEKIFEMMDKARVAKKEA